MMHRLVCRDDYLLIQRKCIFLQSVACALRPQMMLPRRGPTTTRLPLVESQVSPSKQAKAGYQRFERTLLLIISSALHDLLEG